MNKAPIEIARERLNWHLKQGADWTGGTTRVRVEWIRPVEEESILGIRIGAQIMETYIERVPSLAKPIEDRDYIAEAVDRIVSTLKCEARASR